MICVVRIDSDCKISSGDTFLAEGQNRVLCIGEHADVSSGRDPVSTRPQGSEAVRSAIVGAHDHEL